MYSLDVTHWFEKIHPSNKSQGILIWTSLVSLISVSLVDSLVFHITLYDIFNPILIHVCTAEKIT